MSPPNSALSSTLGPGFMGLGQVSVGSPATLYNFRATDFNVNLNQDTQFYDHTIGLVDTIETPGTLPVTKGEQTGNSITLNVQKTFWRPGVKIISGGFSLPATFNTFAKFFELAQYGTWFSLAFAYNCSLKRTYSECRVNSLTVSVTAGDILTMSIDVMGRNMIEGTTGISYTNTEKIITWDKVQVATTNTFTTSAVQSFEITINNNCIPIYTSGYNSTGSLFPKDIRIGMQEVTGTVTFYERGTAGNPLGASTVAETITFTVGDWSVDIPVVYKPIQRASSIHAPLHTLGYISVGKLDVTEGSSGP